MLQPPDCEISSDKVCEVCKLKKAIYGLKKSPRTWFHKFSIVAASYGLCRSFFVHSIFVQYSLVGTTILVVYVNHIVFTSDGH